MKNNDYYIFRTGTRFVLLLIILLTASMGMAQVQVQKGVSYRYNGKNPRTPLPNVVIKYDPERQPAISDSTGAFELKFSNRKMGDRIGLVTVTKREMMVFNQQAVDEWSIRKEPLCLILCDADEFDRQKKEYMELGRNDAKRKYDREKAELERQLEDGKIKQEDLEKALNIAYERLERLQKEIDKYADDLARIDLSELDDKMQEILEMYRRGETEVAIERLKSLKLAEEFDKETAHYEAVQQELQRSDNKLQTLVEQMKNSVALLMNSGEWEEAGKYLKRIADLTNNYDDVFAYAYFCANQNNHQEADDYFNRALQMIDEGMDKDSRDYQYKRNTLLTNLAILYYKAQRLTESEGLFLETLEISRQLAQANPQAYEPDLVNTLNNLGILYYKTRRLTDSEDLFLKALEICRHLVKASPQAYEPDLAITLTNLARLYNDIQRLNESEAMYIEALEINRRLMETNPQAYEPYVATTLTNLANLYHDTQRYSEGETMYIEAMEINRRLAEANPQAYEPDLAMTLNDLANLYQNTQRLSESEVLHLEVLEIHRRLAQSNPQAYEPDLATTLNNLAVLYKETQRYSESEAMYLEALEICRRLAQGNPQAYEPDLAMTLNNLAVLYKETQRFAESETMYIKALEIYRHWAKASPQAYESDLAKTLTNLANLYQNAQRYTEGEALYREALEINRRLVAANSQAYEPDMANMLYNVGLLHVRQEKFLQSIADFEDCLSISRRLAQNNPLYGDLYLGSLYWLAQLYPMTEEHTKYYEVNEEWLPVLKGWYQEDTANNQEEYVNALGNQSLQCTFVKQFEKSEQYAREALSIDSTQHWINTNLASALLLQGKYSEAEAIYSQYKDELKTGFLQDLQDFEAAGVIPEERKADVEKIRKMLNE